MDKQKKCKICGYQWEAIENEPKACPNCKRYDWNKEKEKKDENIR
jgi:rubrerythrin